MRAPSFWTQPPGTLATLLSPLGWVYAKATAYRLAHGTVFDPAIPVVCVGNLTAGGTGKTPTVIAIVQMLLELGANPHVISRGHGGRVRKPTRVDPHRHDASDVGDEPLLLAAFATVWVAHQRIEAAKAAVAAGSDVLVLDDGFQDPSLKKDLSIVVVDARTGFGNARCIPAGPLREPVNVGLERANLIVAIGQPDALESFRAKPEVTRIDATLQPLPTGMDWTGLDVLAFAGIGRPEKFFATLRRLGANVLHAEALSDHQPLTRALMSRLESDAARLGAQLVTTEKDAVRLTPDFRAKVLTLPVRLEFVNPNPLRDVLKNLR